MPPTTWWTVSSTHSPLVIGLMNMENLPTAFVGCQLCRSLHAAIVIHTVFSKTPSISTGAQVHLLGVHEERRASAHHVSRRAGRPTFAPGPVVRLHASPERSRVMSEPSSRSPRPEVAVPVANHHTVVFLADIADVCTGRSVRHGVSSSQG